MEGLIKASKAYEMTKSAVEEKCNEVICYINDGILAATKNGVSETGIFFDGPLPALVEDSICESLEEAGYHIESLGVTEITISWAYPEADEPSTQPTAADENTRPQSILNANNSEDLDDYTRECVVKVGHLRDLVHRAARYDALEDAGVDNWEWYGDAYANACKDWEAENMDEVASKYWESFVNYGIIRV